MGTARASAPFLWYSAWHMSPRSFSKKAAGHDVQDAISWHSSAILALFVFTILAGFGLALWTLKLYVTEQQLVSAVNVVAPMAITAGQNTGTKPVLPEYVSKKLRKGSGFETLEYVNTQCDVLQHAGCTDIAIQDPTTGMPKLIVPSVRMLMAAAGLDAMGLPEAFSSEGRYLTLRVGNLELAGMTKKVVTADLWNGPVVAHPADVDYCVAYSADGRYAADLPLVKDERRSVVVHDLIGGTSKTVVTAAKNETFGVASSTSGGLDAPEFPPCEPPSFVSATSVTFDVFTSSNVTNVKPVFKETRTASFTF
jgi:hypothetical protein